MSTPIKVCAVIQAAKAEAGAQIRKNLQTRLQQNLKFGATSIWPCNCEPKCEAPTEEQLASLLEEVPEAIILMNYETKDH